MDLADRKTEYGCTVGQLKMVSDHYLCQKVRILAESEGLNGAPIALPDTYTRRSVGNLTTIKALVIKASGPHVSLHAGKPKVRQNPLTGQWMPMAAIRHGGWTDPPCREGDGIIYNGFNTGKIWVEGLDEPLIIIRGIDIEAVFPASEMDHVQVGDFAISRASMEI